MKKLLIALLISIIGVSFAMAQPRNAVDVRAEVAAAMYYNSSVVEAIEREHSAEVQRLRQRIGTLEQRVEAGETALRGELADLQERLVRELAERDATLARIVAAFRADVESVASTPQGLEALRLYNAGNWTAANAIFSDIIAAVDRAELLASGIRRAAPRRQRATLASQSRQRGLSTTQEVIGYFEEVTSFDPGEYGDWAALCHLYRDAGRLAEAHQACDRALAVARDDEQRSSALGELGDVFWQEENWSAAGRNFREALTNAERNAASNPQSMQVQRTLARSLARLGEHELVKWGVGSLSHVEGDPLSARAHLERSVEILNRIRESLPDDAGVLREAIEIENMLGDVFVTSNPSDRRQAQEHYREARRLARLLARRDPGAIDLAILDALAELNQAHASDQPAEGDEHFQRAADILTGLIGGDRSDIRARLYLLVTLEEQGNLRWLSGRGDFRPPTERAIAIGRELLERGQLPPLYRVYLELAQTRMIPQLPSPEWATPCGAPRC